MTLTIPKPADPQATDAEFYDAQPAAPANGTALPALVARHAALTPEALAVVDGDTTPTYGRLLRAG
ncbi:hypothetical protein VR43_09940, partial [Streptomyces sp. NRRL S-104]